MLLDFFRARRGPAIAFRFTDPFDNSSNAMLDPPTPYDQPLGTGDGVQTAFALFKTYGGEQQRRITRPVAGTVVVAVDGEIQHGGWTLVAGGIVEFAAAPAQGAVITAGFRFDTPVRFAEDRINASRATFGASELESVPLVEIREDL